VTLNDKASELGVWTPYSWFSSLSNGYDFAAKHWGAVVTEASDELDYGTALVSAGVESVLTKLFDRGYGYVYLTDKVEFAVTGKYLKTLIQGINKKKACTTGVEAECTWVPPTTTGRRLGEAGLRGLQTQDTGVATTNFQCDDTLYECKPVCIETVGVVQNKVPDAKCAGAKPDICSCRCFYDAYWTCEDGQVKCKATISGGFESTVGDLVCSTRGTPKPKWDASKATEARAAGECEKLSVLREERPSDQCLATIAAEKEERAKAKIADAAPAATLDTLDLNIMDAGAPVSALLAAVLALYF